ncbi:MAG: hypothetical protein KAJ90_01720 [Desulfobacterales bacterium]|nr:hypothetical protein [Desulfobacterales bacterium]
MCTLTRKSPDPLLRHFLDLYGLHLLRCPRSGIEVGSMVMVSSGRSAVLERLDDLLDAPVALLCVRNNEPMADIQGLLTDVLDVKSGIGISEAFLQSLGAIGIGMQLSTALKEMRDVGLQFCFSNPLRNFVNPASVGAALVQRHFNIEHPVYDPKALYYVITGVAHSKSIDIRLTSQKERAAEADVELEKLINTDAKIQSTQVDNSTWRFEGETAVVFGLELFELSLDATSRRMRLALPPQPVAVRRRGGQVSKPSPSIIGGETNSPFLGLDG